MPNNLRFPPSVEIKRAIAAALRAGIEIGSVEIHPRKIIIRPMEEGESPESAYDRWKMSEGRNSSRIRHTEKQSGAKLGKSGS